MTQRIHFRFPEIGWIGLLITFLSCPVTLKISKIAARGNLSVLFRRREKKVGSSITLALILVCLRRFLPSGKVRAIQDDCHSRFSLVQFSAEQFRKGQLSYVQVTIESVLSYIIICIILKVIVNYYSIMEQCYFS